MKTKIGLLVVVVAIIISLLGIETSNANIANPQTKFVVQLLGTGYTSTGTVRMHSQNTGVDHYGTPLGGGAYSFNINEDESFDIYACTNHPSYGSELNVKGNWLNAYVTLTGGFCPFGGK